MALMQPYWHWLGAALGVAVGIVEVAALWSAGVRMTIYGRDVVLPVAALFELSFGVVGYLVGRLLQQRAALRADALTIRQQVADLERARAVAAHHERLAVVGRLAAGIAHEVRNPLGVIRSSAAVIRDTAAGDADTARACRFIEEETVRLDGFIATLLAFSKPSSMRRQPCDIADIVTRALDLSAEVARRSGASVVPRLEAAGTFPADPDLVTQVVLGLVVNALEAVGTGGRIRVWAQGDAESVRVRVADDGPGVPPEAEGRLFEPFFTTKSTGTGLGLSMAAQVVAAHGGTIGYERHQGLGPGGAGACFVLSLPREVPLESVT